MNFVVHFKSFSNDVRVGTEIVFPVVIAEQQDRCCAGLFISGTESSAKDRLHAKKIEEVPGHNASPHAIRIAVAVEDERHGVEFDQSGEAVVLLAKILDFVDRKLNVIDPEFILLLAQEDQLVAVGIRKWAQQHRLNDAENGGIGADAEGQRENGDGGETGTGFLRIMRKA